MPPHTDSDFHSWNTAENTRRNTNKLSYNVVFRSNIEEDGQPFHYFKELDGYDKFIAALSTDTPGLEKTSFISTLKLSASHSQKKTFSPFGQPSIMPWENPIDPPKLGYLAEVKFSNHAEAVQIINQWKKNETIWFAEPNGISTLSDSSFELTEQANMYEDAPFWWLKKIQLIQALRTMSQKLQLIDKTEDDQPVIAILDSGVDLKHRAIEKKLWVNERPTGMCPNDFHGCNTTLAQMGQLGVGYDLHPFGTESSGTRCKVIQGKQSGSCIHGTHVAGIISGQIDQGVPGVCPMCQIMVLKIVESIEGSGKIADSAILRALKYVSLFERKSGNLVRVVNSSFGKFHKSRAVSLMVNQLRHTRDGILVIAAAGNEDTMRRVYPAANQNSLAVAALDNLGRKATYSNYGSWIDISAPGGRSTDWNSGILSAKPGGGRALSQGTSMAAPLVSGVAGLILYLHPEITFSELRNSILNSADHNIYDNKKGDGYNYAYYFPEVDGKHVPLLGRGGLNAQAAVTFLTQNNNANVERQITPSCATISQRSDHHVSENLWKALLFLILIPAFMSLGQSVLWKANNKNKRFKDSQSI